MTNLELLTKNTGIPSYNFKMQECLFYYKAKNPALFFSYLFIDNRWLLVQSGLSNKFFIDTYANKIYAGRCSTYKVLTDQCFYDFYDKLQDYAIYEL